MINFRAIKRNLLKIIALTEKNIKLNLRFKYVIIISYIKPIIWVLMPLLIMGQLFQFNDQFGPWTINNYLVYQFLAYNFYLLKGVIDEFPSQFRMEKFWKTLPALIIAPFNRFNLLLGIFFSKLFMIFLPFIVFFVICYIYYPISFITILFIIGIFFAVALIFSGVGLIFGIFAISNENVWRILSFGINLFFALSCISYPFELFPEVVQSVINLNPLYYIFDIVRLAWIDDNLIVTLISNPFHNIILFSCLFFIPFIGVFTFNRIFKKYGIVGY